MTELIWFALGVGAGALLVVLTCCRWALGVVKGGRGNVW